MNESNKGIGNRVHTVRVEQNLTAQQLADLIGLETAKHIYMIEKGKRSLTRKRAERIVSQFPKYRIEWLLGLDDFKTEFEKTLTPIAQAAVEHNSLLMAITAIADVLGYSVVAPKFESGQSAEEALQIVKLGYLIQKGEKSIRLTLEEMNEFENYITDLFEVHLNHLFKLKGGKSNG